MGLTPGRHGGDGAAIARALRVDVAAVLDLSQSLNPLAPDPRPVVARHLDALGRYPDPANATAALAEATGVGPERLLLTNGGAEAITLVAGEIGGSVEEPEFALHPRGTGPRWRSNPHNPSGLLARASERAGVWDEAFYPMVSGRWTRGDDAVVVGSLTKLLACPGLRVGYVLAEPDLVERCRRAQPTWSLNGLAGESLAELLAPIDLAATAAGIAAMRADLVALLARYGLAAARGDANWVLVDRPGLREALLESLVVTRDCTNFALPGVVRIAVPDAAGLERLEAALEAARHWLEQEPPRRSTP